MPGNQTFNLLVTKQPLSSLSYWDQWDIYPVLGYLPLQICSTFEKFDSLESNHQPLVFETATLIYEPLGLVG